VIAQLDLPALFLYTAVPPNGQRSGGWGELGSEKRRKNAAHTSRPLHAVLARFRVIRLVMQNQPSQLSLPLSSYPSRLSRKDLIALFMKEQHVQTYGDGEST
jgi:hypothetical protein